MHTRVHAQFQAIKLRGKPRNSSYEGVQAVQSLRMILIVESFRTKTQLQCVAQRHVNAGRRVFSPLALPSAAERIGVVNRSGIRSRPQEASCCTGSIALEPERGSAFPCRRPRWSGSTQARRSYAEPCPGDPNRRHRPVSRRRHARQPPRKGD